MQTLYYTLGCVAAALIIIAVPVLTIRALLLMARLDATRRALASLIAEGSYALQHASHVLAKFQEELDRVRHTTDDLRRVIAMVQPAAAVGGWARKIFGGRATGPTDNPKGDG